MLYDLLSRATDLVCVSHKYGEMCGANITLQRHLYEHAFSHKGLRTRQAPLSLVACDRKPVILHGQICSKH
jgi:hypothetical protein